MEIIPIADFTWDPSVYALPGEVNKMVILETKIHLHPLSIQTEWVNHQISDCQKSK